MRWLKMDKEAIKAFLVKRGTKPEIAELMMREAEGLESEGWTIQADSGKLCFTTPMLKWWGYGVTTTSRYQLNWAGSLSVYGWYCTALDRKPHWPQSRQPHHPNLRPNHPCMGNGEYALTQPNPFVAARSIASMLAGKIHPSYPAHLYGDVPSGEEVKTCDWCYGKDQKQNLIWRGSQYYHQNCYETRKQEKKT